MKADTEPPYAGERRVRSSGWSEHAGPSAAPCGCMDSPGPAGREYTCRARNKEAGAGEPGKAAVEGSAGVGYAQDSLPDTPNIDPMSPHGSTNGWHCQKYVLRPTDTYLWPLSCGSNHAKQPPGTSLKKSGGELKSAESLLLSVSRQ